MDDIMQCQPYLLRSLETLSNEEISFLSEKYEKHGRDNFEEWLKRNKQTRCYASLILSQLNIDDAEYWRGVHQEYVERNTYILKLITPIFKKFHEYGGKTLCLFENFGAVLSSRESIGCFASGDVDFVVSDEERNLAFLCFEECGFKKIRGMRTVVSNKLMESFFKQEALFGKGFMLNIMKQPIQRKYLILQNKYKKRLNEECYRNVSYMDTEVMLLNPTALVYYNALHFACEHHYSASPGMALCCDVDRVVRTHNIDFQKILQWTNEDNAGLRLHLALDICNFFLKTPIPRYLLGVKSKQYQKLRERIIQDGMMIPQDGKLDRLYTELASDNLPLVFSLISRLWKR